MIKYIYYRLCDNHHEKRKRKNVSSWYASRFAGTVYFMMLWPFTLFFSILMLSSNVFTFFLGFIPFIVLELYLKFSKELDLGTIMDGLQQIEGVKSIENIG